MDGSAHYARGDYWDAHEAWEGVWRETPRDSPERARLAGLIQLCAAAVQAQRGRWRGVATLAARAEKNLAAAEPALAAAVRAWAAEIAATAGWVRPPELTRSGVGDAEAYRLDPPTAEEVGGDEDAMAWDAEGWDGADAPE